MWNNVAISTHIWFLFTGGEQSLWCLWVNSHLLKGRSFWFVNISKHDSWVGRKSLQLRSLVRPLLLHVIGDGKDTFLWYDSWHLCGTIIQAIRERICYAALRKEAIVSEIILNKPAAVATSA